MNETSTTPASVQKVDTTYENNPFYVATKGLDLLFTRAKAVGITLAVLCGLSLLGSIPSSFRAEAPHTSSPAPVNVQQHAPAIPVGVWIGITAITFAVLVMMFLVSTIIRGVSDYTSAQLAAGKTVTFNEAVGGFFSKFWGYVGLSLLVYIKIFLWTLLFIIPGIYMSVRYSLSGLAFFDKSAKRSVRESIAYSSALTKPSWLTTYASQTLMNIITLGFIRGLVAPGTNAVLYRQYSIDAERPRPHALSWWTLVLAVLGFILAIVAIVFFIGILLYVYGLSSHQ